MPASGSRLRHFPTQWEEQGAHRSLFSLLRGSYRLPCIEHPNLSRVPCITSGYAVSDKQSALLTSIQDLLLKGAIKVVYSKQLGILQSAIPGQQTRQLVEDSHRLKLTIQISGHAQIQDGDPRINTGLPQERRVDYLYRSHGRLPACTYPYPVSEIPQIPPQRCYLPVCQPTI